MENISEPTLPTSTEKNTLEQTSKRLLEIISQHTGIGRRGKIVPRTRIIADMAARIQARAEARGMTPERERTRGRLVPPIPGSVADITRLASIARREIDTRSV